MKWLHNPCRLKGSWKGCAHPAIVGKCLWGKGDIQGESKPLLRLLYPQPN